MLRDIFYEIAPYEYILSLLNSIFGHAVGIDYRYQWQFTELINIEQKIFGARLKFCDCVTT